MAADLGPGAPVRFTAPDGREHFATVAEVLPGGVLLLAYRTSGRTSSRTPGARSYARVPASRVTRR